MAAGPTDIELPPGVTRDSRSTPYPQIINVLIAAEGVIVRKGMVSLLSPDKGFRVVGEAMRVGEIVTHSKLWSSAILLIDEGVVNQPGSGHLLTALMGSGTRSIVLVGSSPPLHRLQELRERVPGFCGVVSRWAEGEELHNAVRLVHAGGHLWPGSDQGAPRSNMHPLTPRHLQVAALIGEGNSNKEIGRVLGISEATVKKHVCALLLRLGLKDRLQIALYVVRHPDLFRDGADDNHLVREEKR